MIQTVVLRILYSLIVVSFGSGFLFSLLVRYVWSFPYDEIDSVC